MLSVYFIQTLILEYIEFLTWICLEAQIKIENENVWLKRESFALCNTKQHLKASSPQFSWQRATERREHAQN